jgi:hypothetical protein
MIKIIPVENQSQMKGQYFDRKGAEHILSVLKKCLNIPPPLIYIGSIAMTLLTLVCVLCSLLPFNSMTNMD